MARNHKVAPEVTKSPEKRNDPKDPPRCGAKKRRGGFCQTWAMPNGKCRLHGGASPGGKPGNQNARKHGIYSDVLMPGEAELFDDIKSDQLEQELKIAKLQLRRALLAQNHNGDKPVLDEFTAYKGKGSKSKTREERHRRVNYIDVIQKLLGRIGDLELKRALLLERGGAGDTTPDAFEVVEYDD